MNNINFDALLQLVQDFRSQLEVWGVNSDGLLVVGGLAALLFIFSLREVATWYFRVNATRDEVRELRAQVMALSAMVQETRDYLIHPEGPVVPMKPEELMKAAQGMKESPKFRLDH